MFTFHNQEKDRTDGVGVDAYRIESMAKKLGHEKIDILKMDVEGAEYEVIEDLLKSSMRPNILLIEFHHRFKGIGKEKTLDAVKALREAGYLIVNISVTGMDVCFVHKNLIPNK